MNSEKLGNKLLPVYNTKHSRPQREDWDQMQTSLKPIRENTSPGASCLASGALSGVSWALTSFSSSTHSNSVAYSTRGDSFGPYSTG